MSFKSPIICDRRIYDKRGKWKNPNNDIAENIFYFIAENYTLATTWEVGNRAEFKPTITITIYGGKPIAENDDITLETGETLKVKAITINYVGVNPLIMDMLKPRIENMTLVLE